jgi:signal transduction histidine kinase
MPDSPWATVAVPADDGPFGQRVRELDAMIRSVADVVVVVDEQACVLSCDGDSERVWGLSPRELVGAGLPGGSQQVTYVDAAGEPLTADAMPFARALATGVRRTLPILGVRRPHSATRWLHVVAAPLPRRPGDGPRLMTVWTDLTSVVESDPAEARLRARTAALEATVAELEAFSYTVSHDLRTPARTISVMAEALLAGWGEPMGAEGRRLVERILDTAGRMDALTGILLDLSSAARAEPRRTHLDLSAIARDELERLRLTDPGRRVTAVVADGLAADGDDQLIHVVLHNLLANAWKFTARVAMPRIEVGSLRDGDETAFFVRDNGIGFDMADVARLFLPFERLHAGDEFAGTGIGLATVRRIVERHGGRVWADARPGAGATLFFTLPCPSSCLAALAAPSASR